MSESHNLKMTPGDDQIENPNLTETVTHQDATFASCYQALQGIKYAERLNSLIVKYDELVVMIEKYPTFR